MRKRRYIFAATALIGLCLVTGCSNADKVSAAAAARADLAFQQGQYAVARQYARQALDARDDLEENWLLLARIDVASSNLGEAFDAYESVIQLNKGNVEAIHLLCELALTVHQPDKVDKYADQLLLLNPDDPMPLVMKGGAAFQRGDLRGAGQFVDSVLAKNPRDDEAQMLKARILAAQGNHDSYVQAVKIIEESSSTGKGVSDRLTILKQLYLRLEDRPGYERTLKRLAEAEPRDATIQLEFADMLYQTGSGDTARPVIRRVMQQHPNDIGVASSVLNTWLKEGPQALNVADIPRDSSAASLEMKAAYAQFANEIGRPEIAVAALGTDLANAPPGPQNLDAKAALFYAIGLQGRPADALRGLGTILSVDPVQPRALLAKARLLGAAGNFPDAVAAARQAATQDPQNAVSRLVLVDLLTRQGEKQLAETALREALRAMPDEPRIAARLVALLVNRGQKQDAISIFKDLTQAAPMNLRAQRLRSGLDPTARDAVASKGVGVAAAHPGAG